MFIDFILSRGKIEKNGEREKKRVGKEIGTARNYEHL